MTIRKEITYLTLAILALYAILNYFVMGMVLQPAFDDLERRGAIKDMDRFVGALKSEIRHLDTINHDWAAWDDTYAFIVDKKTDYIRSNLGESSFFDNKLNLIYLINDQGRVVWGKAYDLETEQPIEIREFPTDLFPEHHPLLGLKGTEDFHTGIFISSAGPMLVSARPIITSKLVGPAKGTMIMAKLLSNKYLSYIEEQTRSEASVWPQTEGRFSSEEQKIIDKLTGEKILVSQVDDDTLNVHTLFDDIQGNNKLLLKISVDREIRSAGRKASFFVILSIFVVGVVVMLCFVLLLRARVLAPLRKLKGVIVDVGNHDEFYVEMDVGGCEEVRIFAREFNDMLSKRNLERYKMVNQSYFSGMAEVTSDLIHNIRNTLNPIVADVFLLREKCNYMPLESMKKAIGELVEEKDLDPERKKKIKDFLVQSLAHLEKTRDEVDRKLGRMEKQSDITRNFLDGIEDFSRQGFYVEKFNLKDVMEDVSAFFRNKFSVVRFSVSLANVGVIKSHKSALIQIIINLLQNAGDSVLSLGNQGRVELCCCREVIREREVAHISVKDYGEGILSENMDKIFQRDFSTKDKKVSGIGLHWCANAAKSLGGELYAESEGEGQGACFHLLIPFKPEF